MLERRDNWLKVVLLSWAAYFVAGFGIAAAMGANARDATQFGANLLVWGAALRTAYPAHLWHTTWAVNSAPNFCGYRNYDTPDRSRNNAIVAVPGGGGWHNNHHADSNSARHGHAWWEFDLSWLTIRLLERLGLATDVILAAVPAMRRTRPIGGSATARRTGVSREG
jgi:fatty-acid desaturase